MCHLQCRKLTRWKLSSRMVPSQTVGHDPDLQTPRGKQKQLHWTRFLLENWHFSSKCQGQAQNYNMSEWSKRRCSFFSLSSTCCSGETANDTPKATAPNSPKEQWQRPPLCLAPNIHFVAEVIKQVPQWLLFLSTITGTFILFYFFGLFAIFLGRSHGIWRFPG